MIDKKKVESIVNEWLEGKEYFLTDLTVSDDDSIVVEIDHKDGVWIDDCVDLSRFIEGKLDRNDEDYELEVGSAGIGQPFKVYRQYENHVGDGVEVHTNNREKLKGVLKAVDENGFIGIFTGGIKATAGGVGAAILFGFIAALVSKPKIKG